MARCSIFDFSDQKIVSHESVINYGHYEFIYYQGISLLEPVSLTKSGTVTAENHNPLVFDSIEYSDGLMYDINSGNVHLPFDEMYIFFVILYK